VNDDALMAEPDSPNGWLAARLDALDLDGTDVTTMTNTLLGLMRLDDIRHWSRPGLQAAIRNQLRARGFIVNHAVKSETTGQSPVALAEQLAFEEIVAFLEARHRQAEADRASTMAIAQRWVAQHPESEVTAEQLMSKAGWAA